MATPQEFAPRHIEAAQAGDRGARERILTRLEPILRGYFIKRIGKRTEVDDLVQNTLMRVHNGLNDLKQPTGFMGFAMKAALFELQDLYRGRYSPKESLYDPDDTPEMISKPERSGLRVDLERALLTLTPRARKIIELREIGYRYKEIAEMIGTTEAAVKMQVKRAFERLRELLVVS